MSVCSISIRILIIFLIRTFIKVYNSANFTSSRFDRETFSILVLIRLFLLVEIYILFKRCWWLHERPMTNRNVCWWYQMFHMFNIKTRLANSSVLGWTRKVKRIMVSIKLVHVVKILIHKISTPIIICMVGAKDREFIVV